MGEYFAVYNLSKKEVIKPHAFGDGNKSSEIVSGTVGGLCTALFIMLNDSWCGDRVAVIGDEHLPYFIDTIKRVSPLGYEYYVPSFEGVLLSDFKDISTSVKKLVTSILPSVSYETDFFIEDCPVVIRRVRRGY